MKKYYVSPAVECSVVVAGQMIATSVTSAKVGDSNMEIGDMEKDDGVTAADAKGKVNSVEWESWEDQEEQ